MNEAVETARVRLGRWLRNLLAWLQRLAAVVRRLVPEVRAEARHWQRRISERWRRSLALRVSTATLVLCAIVVSILGYFIMQRFVSDLYASREKAADNVAQVGLNNAEHDSALAVSPAPAPSWP